MATIISVPFSVSTDEDAIKESWDPSNGPQAIVKFHVSWANRYQFVKDMIGTFVGTPPSTITRTVPFRYPPSPNMFAVGIEDISPLGKPIPMPGIGLPWMARQTAVVIVRFGVPQWNVTGNDAYTKVTFAASGEFLSVPETSVKFSSDGTVPNTTIGFLMPQMEITVTRSRMPFLPIAAMLQCEGKINNAPYQILGIPFDTGKLLFVAGQSDFQQDATGQIAYSQEYKFLARSINWNMFLRPDGGGFDTVTDLSNNPVYGSANFNTLP